ncbi:MAG: hypothetical protein O2925_07765 [Actinomycetota bacterium]|jgi:prolyl-tRNA editing enzyme YbaK/EbsC (Cys-tRNA(Pro) deacylase)|nr:hypothetical protein [Actinomycetota bacterium]MDA3028683.1 hypothetical protein [Actinomycetota bacterium]
MSDPVEQRVIDSVSVSGGAFELFECDSNLADTAAFCDAYGFEPADSANTIIVATKEDPPRFVACVVLATHRLDVNGAVRRRLGAKKVSFAPAEMTSELTGMIMGGVTPFGLPAGIPVWVDSAVVDRERIIMGGGSRALKLLLPPKTLIDLDAVEVVEQLARPAEPT